MSATGKFQLLIYARVDEMRTYDMKMSIYVNCMSVTRVSVLLFGMLFEGCVLYVCEILKVTFICLSLCRSKIRNCPN